MDAAPELLQSYFRRWSNLEEQKAAVAEDLKELFSEAKGNGLDTKVMRAAFRIKAKQDNETDADREQVAMIDVYLEALNGSRASRAYARENIEEFDPETGEVFEESPRKAAEAVPEMAANQSLANGPCDAATERSALVGSVTSSAVAGVLGQPETIPALTGQHASANVSGSERAGVTAGETATISEPKLNERCQQPSQCKFSHHPQKITCSACTAAWAVKMKAKVAA